MPVSAARALTGFNDLWFTQYLKELTQGELRVNLPLVHGQFKMGRTQVSCIYTTKNVTKVKLTRVCPRLACVV